MQSFYEVTVKTLNQDKIINNLSKKIELYNVEKIDYNILKLQVKYSNKKILNKYIKNNNLELIKNKSFGLFYFILKVFKRWGVSLGIVFSIISFFILNNFIFKIEVIGNENISKKDIINYLNSNNYNITSKFNLDCDKIASKLQENFSEISLVSVITKGSTLVVNIKVKLQSEIVNQNFAPMVASYDGKITNIILSQGTLNVKVGQTVKKGDVLVYPYIIDSSGNKRDILPQASIMAKVWVDGKICYKENQIAFIRTGTKKIITYLKIGDIYLTTPQSSPFKKFDMEEKVCYIANNNILPIKKYQITYYETKETIINNNFEEDKENLIQECKQIALQKINEYDIIKNEKVYITRNAGIVNLKVVLELEKDITYEN